MLRIEELLRWSLGRKTRKAAPVKTAGAVHNRSQETAAELGEAFRMSESKTAGPVEKEWTGTPEPDTETAEDMFEPEEDEALSGSGSEEADIASSEPESEGTEEANMVSSEPEPESTEEADPASSESEPESTEEADLAPSEPEPENTEEPDVMPDEIKPERTQEPEAIPEAEQESVTLQDSVAETEELEQISEQIGQDVTDMIDMKKEDFLLQQIDEFREKAKQLQKLMKNRETKAKELQGVVDEREAKASELDGLIQVRKGEADRIMENVSERIDEMSAGVRNEMSGLSDTLSREVSGLSQNLTQELGSVSQNLTQEVSGLSQNLTQEVSGLSQNLTQEVSGLSQNLTKELSQSTEKTRQAVEVATKNMIDQNTRSLEGLKEQLEQIDQREQFSELSTEMNSQITTLKADIVDKIHAEDVKCYRNIQVSLDDQSKLLSEGDEKIRQYIQEQMESLNRQVKNQAKFVNASLFFSIINFLGIAGILVVLFLF